MQDILIQKIRELSDRLSVIIQDLSDPDVYKDMDRYKKLNQEHADIHRLVTTFNQYQNIEKELTEIDSMMDEEEYLLLIEEEKAHLITQKEKLYKKIQLLLLPADPMDQGNIFLEIRAGTGGQESTLFAASLFRMYTRFAERNHWNIEVVSESISDLGGYKEIIVRLSGDSVYSQLKFESGGHRVQRVPQTETQGRIHTSACTVAVIAEANDVEHIDIPSQDLRIDTFRASGAGGQHVNRTDSAVRITHIPTGIVAECQDGRSQHKNKAQAMSVLVARILDRENQQRMKEEAAHRKSLIGSGDRSERIRTYNFPQGRITDHRIGLTLYKIEAIMDGDLYELINALTAQYQSEELEKVYGTFT